MLWLPRYPTRGSAWHGDAAGSEAAQREQTHVSPYAAAAGQTSAVAPAVEDESAALGELTALLSRAVRRLRCFCVFRSLTALFRPDCPPCGPPCSRRVTSRPPRGCAAASADARAATGCAAVVAIPGQCEVAGSQRHGRLTAQR